MYEATLNEKALQVIRKTVLVYFVLALLAAGAFANIPQVCTERGVDSLDATAVSNRVWKGKKSLRVGFINGSDFVQKKVRYYAGVWSNYANIGFNFDESGPSDIRVAFTQDGNSWSYVGNGAKNVDKNEPTMSFGGLDDTTPEDIIRRIILHELGHALGLIHEHQSPVAGINWNKKAVYDYYKEKFDWNKNVVNDNIFMKYSRSRTQYTKYDPTSIMHYSIPAEFTLEGKPIQRSTNLSQMDIEFIKTLYP